MEVNARTMFGAWTPSEVMGALGAIANLTKAPMEPMNPGRKMLGFRQTGFRPVGFRNLGFRQTGFRPGGSRNLGFRQQMGTVPTYYYRGRWFAFPGIGQTETIDAARDRVGLEGAVGPAIVVGVLVLLGLRVAASWFVGKQFNRPVSGAIVGGIFGAIGLGALSLFPGEKK